jgi:hypothetical protein
LGGGASHVAVAVSEERQELVDDDAGALAWRDGGEGLDRGDSHAAAAVSEEREELVDDGAGALAWRDGGEGSGGNAVSEERQELVDDGAGALAWRDGGGASAPSACARALLSLAATSLQAATSAAFARWTETEVDLPVTEWVGIAASPNKQVFTVTSQRNEAAARNAAKFECEQATGRTCRAKAVPTSWDVVVMSCKRPGQSPVSFVGGSRQSAATEVALAEAYAAGFYPSNCVRVYSY